MLILIYMVANAITKTKMFDYASITVILLNSLVMIFDDPTEEPTAFFQTVENVFLGLYTLEMVLKIIGSGFIFAEDAYLKEPWNILDFLIVVISYFTLFTTPVSNQVQSQQTSEGFSFASLRVFRVLRPLKTISSIKGLKVLMQALFSALPLLRDTLVILVFFFVIFAIAGC